MTLTKSQWIPFWVHAVALVVFTTIFLMNGNYEFMVYIAVIIALMAVIYYTNDKMKYPTSLMWGLTLWSIIHMAGGSLYFNGIKLYDTMIFNIVGEPYKVFKYDQFAHIFGFFVATILMYSILRPLLAKNAKRGVALAIILVMAGTGAGALNEVIEFGVTLFVVNHGVGGYENTGLDLVSNLIGSLVAMTYIFIAEKKKFI